MKNYDVCIYHHPCADGFGAAWVVRKALGGVGIEFIPGQYQTDMPMPDVKGKHVLMVDFSYKYHVMLRLAESAESINVLDHHRSAMEDLLGQDQPLPRNVNVHFDMSRSGAMLAWDHFFPDRQPPRLLRHIEDRDLWRFALDGTREIMAAVFSYPYEFAVWDQLMDMDVNDLRDQGVAINRKLMKDVNELIAMGRQRLMIAGHDVPAVNVPYTMSSEAGHILAKGEPFAACYYDTGEFRNFSLRSADDGLDVSRIAAQFGGGGHAHAAGFKMHIGPRAPIVPDLVR